MGVDIVNITQLGLQIDTGPSCVGTTPPDAGAGGDALEAGGGDAADAGVSSDAGDGG